jgi:Na+/proline symporter
LTGLKTLFRGKRGAWPGFLPAVAMVCLILLAMLAVAQVTHLHSSQSDADQCQLCIVMHTVVPVAAAAAVIVIVQLGASTPQAQPILVARYRQIRLFIRPPPISC